CTSSATSWSAPSPYSSSGAHWPPGMTSTPPSTAAPSSSPPSSPGYAVRRHALAVDPQAHGALGLAGVLLLAQGVALVVLLLAPGEGDEHLGLAPDEVQLQRDHGVPLLPALAGEAVDLGAVQEQLALAAHGVVGPGALGVLRD